MEMMKVGDAHAARPLDMLVKLIREDLEAARAAAKNASEPYYVAAGRKMLEAKGQMKHGEFVDWVKRHFDISIRSAQLYMSLTTAEAEMQRRNDDSSTVLSFRKAIQRHTPNTSHGKPGAWRADLAATVKNAKQEAKRLAEEELTRQQERDAERKLALQLIDIGFKALASKLHPDKGGSRDAMSRLNRVRDRLKNHA